MNDVFKYLYERFLFRDLLSFVVPGAIALYGILRVLGYSTHTILERLINFPWPLYVGLWGLLFFLGFGVQALGHHPFPWQKDNFYEFIRLESKGRTPRDVYGLRRRLRATGLSEQAEQTLERMIALRQMAGNCFTALALTGSFILCRWGIENTFCEHISFMSNLGRIFALLLGGLLWVSLRTAYCNQFQREQDWTDVQLEPLPPPQYTGP